MQDLGTLSSLFFGSISTFCDARYSSHRSSRLVPENVALTMLDDKNPAGSSREVVRHDSGTDFKRTAGGIVLVPQPSDDPVDPLNWSLTKKVVTLSIVSAAAAIGMAQMLANQSGFFVQGRVYRKTPVQMSYSVGVETAYPRIGHSSLPPRSAQQLSEAQPVLSSGLLSRNGSARVQ